MLSVLYIGGLSLKRDYKILSISGIAIIIVFTFVEGLRFGRGIDYNHYWEVYNNIMAGHEYEKSFVYNMICETLIYFSLPFKFMVALMSLVYIWALLFFLRNYRNIVHIALPLFVFFSYNETENMVRWYLAYSFLLIGIFYLLKVGSLNFKFLFFTILACSLHYAFFPVPIVFFILSRFNKPIFHPFVSIIVFLGIYFLFETEYMESLVEMIQALTIVSDSAYGSYVDNAEYWLTGGFQGEEVSGKITISMLSFMILILYYGYFVIKDKGKLYAFAYNCFLFGLFLYPLSKKIELVERYDRPFFFFIAIVLAIVILELSKVVRRNYRALIYSAIVLCFVFTYRGVLYGPFIMTEKMYMFVWDHTDETPNSMLNVHYNAQHEIFEYHK